MHVRPTARPARLAAAATGTTLLALGLALGPTGPASAHVTVTPSDTAAGAYTVLTFSVRPRLRGLAHHRGPDPDPRGHQRRDADPQRPLRRHQGGREARPAGHRRPRQRAHRAGRHGHLHRPHPAARRLPRRLRALAPAARGRRRRDPRVPGDPDLRAGRDRLDRDPAEGQDVEELERPAPAVEVTEAGEEGHHGGGEEAEAGGRRRGRVRPRPRAAAMPPPPSSAEADNTWGYVGAGLGALGPGRGGRRPRSRVAVAPDTCVHSGSACALALLALLVLLPAGPGGGARDPRLLRPRRGGGARGRPRTSSPSPSTSRCR